MSRATSLILSQLPETITKDDVKEYFVSAMTVKERPVVVMKPNGNTAVVILHPEDARKVLMEANHRICDQLVRVAKMPPPFLKDASVTLEAAWASTLRQSYAVRKSLEDDYGITCKFVDDQCIFEGNFFEIRNLHRRLEDLLGSDVTPLVDSCGEENEFEIIGETDDIMSDLATVSTSSEQRQQYNNKSMIGKCGKDTSENPSKGHMDEKIIYLDKGVANSYKLAHVADFNDKSSSGEMSKSHADESLCKSNTDPKDKHSKSSDISKQKLQESQEISCRTSESYNGPNLAELVQVNISRISSRKPKTAHIVISKGLLQYIKHRKQAELAALLKKFDVSLKSSAVEGNPNELRIKISARNPNDASLVREAQEQFTVMCKSVESAIQQIEFNIHGYDSKAEMVNTLKDETLKKYSDIVILLNPNGSCLFVGESRQVQEASKQFEDALTKITTPHNSMDTDNADVENVEEKENLLQEMLSRDKMSESVINDILDHDTSQSAPIKIKLGHKKERESELLVIPQVTGKQACDCKLEATAIADHVHTAKEPIHPELPANRNHPNVTLSNACSFCSEKTSRLTKLENCMHQLCGLCYQQCGENQMCPVCEAPMIMSPVPFGIQPAGGKMVEKVDKHPLPGFEKISKGTIVISYYIPDGVQRHQHPNPGKSYKGMQVTTYLPDTTEGREVLQMMRIAFTHRLTFTVVPYPVAGHRDRVTLSPIFSHKTETAANTRNGYPDPDYIRKVKQELRNVGITPDVARKHYLK